jgi:uncharacterized membrane protein
VSRAILGLHVASGGIALFAGYIALASAKGSPRHRWVGRVFVFAMVAMGLTGALIAAVTAVRTSVVMGIFAAYLTFTGFSAVARAGENRRLGFAGAVVAAGLAAALVDLGRQALASPSGVIEDLPAPMAFLFASVAALASVSDVRWSLRADRPGRGRLVRHLWRMCFALFIAAASFFLGQTDEIPRALRAPVLLAPPVIAPLLVMFLWAWRTRRREEVKAAAPAGASAAEA